MQVTTRGAVPCCAMKKLCQIFSRVVRQFDGLGQVELSWVVCPGCVISDRAAAGSSSSPPHCFSLRALRRTAAQPVNPATEQRSVDVDVSRYRPICAIHRSRIAIVL